MKKYNKPEIVTLALDAVDVIETSTLYAQNFANNAFGAEYKVAETIERDIVNMDNDWSW